MTRFLNIAQSWAGRVLVVVFFLVIPVGVWWIASPLIMKLPLDDEYRGLMNFFVLASMIFGLTSMAMVWKDLDGEP